MSAGEESHYDILGVTHKASLPDIRAAYKHLSLTCHPDKIRTTTQTATSQQTTNSKSRAEEAMARAQAQTRWAKIEQAHELLSDPITRAMYDIDAGFVPNTEIEHARIARLKRKEAQVAVATMEETVAQNRAEEEKRGGLLILSARYGDLSASDLDQSNAVSAPYIDVSVPLQCMVHDSALILGEGRSKFWLEGFYDPSMGVSPEQNRLYIRYRFLGQLHEAEFGDLEAVAIPVEDHCIEGTNLNHGVEGGRPSSSHAFQASRSAVARARQKARRRYVLYSTVLLLGVGAYLIRTKRIDLESAGHTMRSWSEWFGQLIGRGGAGSGKKVQPTIKTEQ